MAYQIGKCLLSERLRQAGMTQAQLAERLGVTRQQVSKWVRGQQRMTLESAKNVSVILDCYIEDLFEWIPAATRK
ncbi:helix-turn-helix transcriptional regulator [Bacillus sp. T33-2]|uniref:helix-turn-helix transcriptional regulator n=1 Tax=Bacillus sp. T33-2 TaxID=2054168 RepID=UPI000C782F69|nr:helix-turn-helix transcriptional regulator [Bacillus sp. T33-2]PLR93235.1 XRE family transcriptional regulator [Bacillus sp. T33-2]